MKHKSVILIIAILVLLLIIFYPKKNQVDSEPVRQTQEIRSGETSNDQQAVEAIESDLKQQ